MRVSGYQVETHQPDEPAAVKPYLRGGGGEEAESDARGHCRKGGGQSSQQLQLIRPKPAEEEEPACGATATGRGHQRRWLCGRRGSRSCRRSGWPFGRRRCASCCGARRGGRCQHRRWCCHTQARRQRRTRHRGAGCRWRLPRSWHHRHECGSHRRSAARFDSMQYFLLECETHEPARRQSAC